MKNQIICLSFFLLICGSISAQVKIMPLGNSITAGQFNAAIAPQDNNSFRKEMLRLLRLHNYTNTLFVGSNVCGDIDQPNNEGHSGWKISELTNGRSSSDGIKIWIPAYNPDIILLEIGTNDFNTSSPNLSTAKTNMDNLIAGIFTQKSSVKLVVASVIPIYLNNNYFKFNAELVNLVKKYKTLGRNIWFYDLHNCGISIEGFRDRLHPNAEIGYPVMGKAWFGVTKFLLDSVSVNPYVANPTVSNFADRTIVRWHPSFAATIFNLKSSATLAGPYTPVATGVSTCWAEDKVPSNQARYYIVEGYTHYNRLIYSDTLSSAVSGVQPISINCGNGTTDTFIEDVLYTGGNMYWFYYSTVSKTADASTIPDNVFKTARGGNSTYQFSGLNTSTSYKLSLYFMEGDKTGSGQRVFDVLANGTKILTSFDVHATAGGKDKAIKREFTITPAAGALTLQFKSITDSAIINGIKLEPILLVPVIRQKNYNATAGIPFSLQLESDGGEALIVWSSNSLPSGWTLSTSGLLQGAVSAASTIPFTVKATDASGDADSKTLNLVVDEFVISKFCEISGNVVIEAENFTSTSLNGDATGSDWVKSSKYAGYSGTGYIETVDNNNSTNGVWASASDLSYDVNFNTAGTYNMWMYRYGPDGDSNSAQVGLNGAIVGGAFDNGGTGSWGWVKHGTQFSIANTGTQTINVRRREDGFAIDKILLTTSATTPTGNAQTETLCILDGINVSKNEPFSLFPNPFQNKLFFRGKTANAKVDVYNCVGELVLSQTIDNSDQSINVEKLLKGIYLVRLTNNNNTVKTFKVTKTI